MGTAEQLQKHYTQLRVPKVLITRVRVEVEKKKGEYSRYSMNDWIVEAIREKLDRPVGLIGELVARTVVATEAGQLGALFPKKRTAEEIAAGIPGLKTGRKLVDPETGE